jgi:hypothetical protein
MTNPNRTSAPGEAATMLPCPFCDGTCAVTKGYSRSELPWGDDGGDSVVSINDIEWKRYD